MREYLKPVRYPQSKEAALDLYYGTFKRSTEASYRLDSDNESFLSWGSVRRLTVRPDFKEDSSDDLFKLNSNIYEAIKAKSFILLEDERTFFPVSSVDIIINLNKDPVDVGPLKMFIEKSREKK